jgi:ubiquinone/menaquinone biosynthesis C-methylase UbiE
MTRSYFNSQADTWDEVAAEKDLTKLEWLARSLDIRPGATVLDVGTGTGVFVPFLLAKIGNSGRLVALDFAEEMLKRAKAKGFRGNIEYLNADICHVPLPGEAVDAVVCYSSFPHFQDKPGALREISRLLKKGGKLSIGHTSGREEINEVHRQIPQVRNDLVPDEAEMRQMLRDAGFVSIEICDACDRYLVSAVKPL